MIPKHSVELLAPAKDLTCGIEAINHGADAVYIGAPRFGARAAAGNSLEDISSLVTYAHIYNVKIYVALNTILYDSELEDTEKMIWALYRAGVDALIIQDMGITKLNLPPIPLHGSTQMDNRSVEKVRFLSEAGFRQVVLARELSLDEIRTIHEACPEVSLEAFVHGALCVSFSGQCYASQSCYGRSANRGECAQFCRLSFDLLDAESRVIAKNKHLLSLKDMNQSNNLEALLDAGVSSFKIEGRLKDVSYVKNVTAYYRQKLDEILKRRPEFMRSSSGSARLFFVSQLDKSFNRGFTEYFIKGRKPDICSFDTPKSLGEEVGTVKDVHPGYFTVAGVKSFSNGDGLCYVDDEGVLQGFRINKVDANKIYPQEMPRLKPKTVLFRNYDKEFKRVLDGLSAVRKLNVRIELAENNYGFTLTMQDEDGNRVAMGFPYAKEKARTPQEENQKVQLGKLGNTPFEVKEVEVLLSESWFIPSSLLAEWRRRVVERLLMLRRINYRQEIVRLKETHHSYPERELTYLGNVMNHKAEDFYRQHGVTRIAPAFEKKTPEAGVLMFCKHCIRYSMGWCPVHQKGRSPYKEPYFLVSGDGRRFRLQFDCRNCLMKVLAE